MAYGSDVSVYVEDKAGDVGAPGASPFWLSPDIDIPAHPGVATQGPNQVRIRVHTNDEPVLQELIVAEVYVGNPSLVLSPTNGTRRIDPGNLRFRTLAHPGTETVANVAGGTIDFSWTPSSTAGAVDGPGHRCLVLRAFPESVTPPTSAFDVPNEQHEAQHNIDILTTTKFQADMSSGGAGTPEDPRKREKRSGLWWERISTMAAGKKGKRTIAWAFDPIAIETLGPGILKTLKKAKVKGFSDVPPASLWIDPDETRGEGIDVKDLLRDRKRARAAGLGKGLFSPERVLGTASLDLGPRKVSSFVLRFDLSNLEPRTAAVLHGVQWDENGRPEGGMTLVAIAPV